MARRKPDAEKTKANVLKGKAMVAVAKAKDIGHARVELPRRDFDRLKKLSSARGLSISAYIRQAVLLAMKADEDEGVGR